MALPAVSLLKLLSCISNIPVSIILIEGFNSSTYTLYTQVLFSRPIATNTSLLGWGHTQIFLEKRHRSF